MHVYTARMFSSALLRAYAEDLHTIVQIAYKGKCGYVRWVGNKSMICRCISVLGGGNWGVYMVINRALRYDVYRFDVYGILISSALYRIR